MNPENTNQPVGMGTTPAGGVPPMMPAPAKHGVGGVIALVVIVLALLAGGYFLMGKMNGGSMKNQKLVPPTQENVGETTGASMEASAAVDPNTVQGTSIEVSDIEKDINTTDLDSLSADLNAI